jgi:hypothetical protein
MLPPEFEGAAMHQMRSIRKSEELASAAPAAAPTFSSLTALSSLAAFTALAAFSVIAAAVAAIAAGAVRVAAAKRDERGGCAHSAPSFEFEIDHAFPLSGGYTALE